MDEKQINELLGLAQKTSLPVKTTWSGDPRKIAGVITAKEPVHVFLGEGHGHWIVYAVAAANMAPDLAREVLELRPLSHRFDNLASGVAVMLEPLFERADDPEDLPLETYVERAFSEINRLRQREAQARALFETLTDLATIDEIEGTLPEDAAELAQKARAWMEGE